MSKISIVVPVFNEEEVLEQFHQTVCRELESKAPSLPYELIYVNDGSSDSTSNLLARCHEADPERVVAINFLRNFGQVPALLAGLQHASGDCAIVISADLQDPPSLIPEMVREWQGNHKLVIATRKSRHDDWVSRIASKIFYSLMGRFANPHIPLGGFDYFLLDRALLNRILQMDERNHFLQGLVLWPGYKPKYLYYERQKRNFGKTHWTYQKKIKYFIDGFAAYSLFPIRLIGLVGGILFLSGLFGFLICALMVLAAQKTSGGWVWIMNGLTLLSGLQLFAMSVIGEYVWRNLEQVRKRPLYIIESMLRGKNS